MCVRDDQGNAILSKTQQTDISTIPSTCGLQWNVALTLHQEEGGTRGLGK